ncbi:MAG: hypothetical protein PHO75_02325 [Candidatus Shapirobacteria bacterium]|nr:hypothetical protein [Candidatus Shapirobacteria bacterium]
MKINTKKESKVSKIFTPKNKKIGKVVLFSLSFILLTGLFYVGFSKAAKFLNANEFVKYPVVKIQFHKPFEFVPNEVMAERRAMDKLIQEKSIEWAEELKNPDPIIDFNDPTTYKEEQIQKYAQLFWDHIWESESSKGKNTDPTALHIYCRNKGMWNEIGYSPSTKYCFSSEAEAIAFVPEYIQRNCDGKLLSQCLCYWNKGTKDETCAYSEGNLSMAN